MVSCRPPDRGRPTGRARETISYRADRARAVLASWRNSLALQAQAAEWPPARIWAVMAAAPLTVWLSGCQRPAQGRSGLPAPRGGRGNVFRLRRRAGHTSQRRTRRRRIRARRSTALRRRQAALAAPSASPPVRASSTAGGSARKESSRSRRSPAPRLADISRRSRFALSSGAAATEPADLVRGPAPLWTSARPLLVASRV